MAQALSSAARVIQVAAAGRVERYGLGMALRLWFGFWVICALITCPLAVYALIEQARSGQWTTSQLTIVCSAVNAGLIALQAHRGLRRRRPAAAELIAASGARDG